MSSSLLQLSEEERRKALDKIANQNNPNSGDQVNITSGGETGDLEVNQIKGAALQDFQARMRGNMEVADEFISKPDYIKDDMEYRAILDRKKDLSQGLTAQEMQGMRDASNRQINRAQMGAQRSTAASQAASGLRGGAATRQMSDINNRAAGQKIDFERDLMLSNLEAKRVGLADYGNTYERAFLGDRGAQSKYENNKLGFGLKTNQMYQDDLAMKYALDENRYNRRAAEGSGSWLDSLF